MKLAKRIFGTSFFSLIVIICCSLFVTKVNAQTGNVRGFVYNASNGDALMFANVVVENTTLGATTDVNGFFVVSKIAKGKQILHFHMIGYADTTLEVDVKSNTTINVRVEMKPQAETLNIVEIKGERVSQRQQTNISVEKITASDITKMPSIGGQADFAQYIQVLPGVVFSGDQGGQLYIRGGSAIQNKVLLDGMVIYNPFHSIGLFSVFETDIIRSADIYTGGFNGKYGGRISSIMDITTKDGNRKNFSGKVSVSTFGASTILEGPLIKETDTRNYSLSYLLTAKNSYLSKTSTSLYDYMDVELPYDFFDVYGKLTLASKGGSKVSLFGFNFTDDVNGYKNIADFNWRNTGVGANVILVPQNSPSIVKAVVAYSKYTMNMNEISTSSEQNSNISSFIGNLDVARFFGKNQLNYGVDVLANTTDTKYEELGESLIDYSTDAAAYAVFKGKLGGLIYEPSVRYSYYASLDEGVLEPRLSLKYNITNWLRIKAAVGKYSQSFLDTKSDRDIVNLFTGYLTASPDLPGGVVSSFKGEVVDSYVEKANHYIAGVEIDLIKHLTLNMEVYYKTMDNLISVNRDRLYNDDNDHVSFPDYLKKAFSVESGKAYGGDASLKYSDGRLYVWAIYSYGYVEKESETQVYNPHYDRRHNVNILVSYQVGRSRSCEVSARWNYGSGFPFTPNKGFARVLSLSNGANADYLNPSGTLTTMYGALNSRRLPAYHRLDISVKKRFDISRRINLELEASVTNAYDRNNMFYYDRMTSERVDQLPIMPSIGMTMHF